MKWFIPLVVVFILLAGTDRASADEELRFAGCSTSTLSYMYDMAKAYEKKTGIRIDVRGGGATLGIKSAIAGTVDMGGTCRHLKGEERSSKAKLTPVGYDAVVFLVHPDNPTANVTLDQAIDIMEGRIINWRKLGGPDRPIIVVERRSPNAGVRLSLKEMLGGYEIKLTTTAIKLQSTAEVEIEIEKNPYSFGISGSGSAVQRNLKILKFNGVAAVKDNFLSGKYPFVRPLYLTTRGEPSPKMERFFDFLLGNEGQAVVAKHAISLIEFKKKPDSLFEKGSMILKPRLQVKR